MTPGRYKVLPVEEIDLQDERFRIRPTGALDPVMASIREVGLIQPPLLVKREDRLVIMSGWRRVSACLCLGRTDLPVLIEEIPEDLTAFRKSFYENLSIRKFSPAEKADVLKKFLEFGEEPRILVRRFLPLLGIPSTRRHLDDYLGFAGLDEDTRLMIHEIQPDFATLRILAAMTRKERLLLRPFLQRLGKNRRKQVLSDLHELTRIRDVSVEEIMGGAELRTVFKNSQPPGFEQAENLRVSLRRLRYPRLSAWRERFSEKIADLELPSDVRIDPGPNFEGDEMSLSFSFRDGEELRDTLRRLMSLAGSRRIEDLFRVEHDD